MTHQFEVAAVHRLSLFVHHELRELADIVEQGSRRHRVPVKLCAVAPVVFHEAVIFSDAGRCDVRHMFDPADVAAFPVQCHRAEVKRLFIPAAGFHRHSHGSFGFFFQLFVSDLKKRRKQVLQILVSHGSFLPFCNSSVQGGYHNV